MVIRDGQRDGFRLPRDQELLERAVVEMGPALIVFGGSIMSHIQEGSSANEQPDMRRVFEPLHDIADRYELAVLAVGHPNKSRIADPGAALSGSAAQIQTVRSALYLEFEDEEGDDDPRVLAHYMTNNAAKEESLVFVRKMVELPVSERRKRPINMAALQETGTSSLTAVDLMIRQLQRTSGGTRVSQVVLAEQFMSMLLSDRKPHPADEIKQTMLGAGFAERTIQRAARKVADHSRDTSVPPNHFWTKAKPSVRKARGAKNGPA